jgi:hypothetical protein
MPLARTKTFQALAIDRSLPDGHALAGLISAIYDYDWAEADRHHDPIGPAIFHLM